MIHSKTTAGLLGLLLGSSLHAATIAYWNFEDGVAGQAFTPAGQPNGSGGSTDVQSSILMHGWNSTAGPSFAPAVTPNGGTLAMNNAGQDGYVFDGALQNWTSSTWTIEMTVMLRNVDGWKTMMGRDGASLGGNGADLYIQKSGDVGDFRIAYLSQGGNLIELSTGVIPASNTWYGLAFTSDGSTLKAWVDTGLGYNEVSSVNIAGFANNGIRSTNNTWTFGRGWFGGSFVDHIDGSMDNIRVSDTALTPGQMISLVPEPSTALLLGVVGLLTGRRRR